MEKRSLICTSAAKVFATKGFHDTKVKTIANEADIAVGTIYNYFKSKDEILEYIFKVENHKRIKFLSELKCVKRAYLDKLMNFCDFHLGLLRENPNIAKVLVQELIVKKGNEINSVRTELVSIERMVGELLDDAHRNGETREINTAVTSRIILDVLRGAVLQEQYDGNEQEFQMLREDLKTFIISAVKKN